MAEPAFNFSGGWSYVIGGSVVSFAIYDVLSRAVLVCYVNNTYTIVPNVFPFNSQYNAEGAILALVASRGL